MEELHISAMSETILWKGSSSQWVNIVRYAFALVIGVAGLVGSCYWSVWSLLLFGAALLWAIWQYLVVRCRRYELTNQRLRIYEGVLNQTIDELELYRVKDIAVERPILLRLVKLSTLVLMTSDRSHPDLRLSAVKGGMQLLVTLRETVEERRESKRVREMDFTENGEGHTDFETFE